MDEDEGGKEQEEMLDEMFNSPRDQLTWRPVTPAKNEIHHVYGSVEKADNRHLDLNKQ